MTKNGREVWGGENVGPGETRELEIAVSESYSSMTVKIPIHVSRGESSGPVVFVTAALHGDEINGTGAIRQLIQDPEVRLKRGVLLLVPVLNLLAFDRHSRYLPDRRDLNRSFPGSAKGSLASRMARTIFDQLIARCDFGIDLHTASVRRTNYPNTRGDLSNADVRRMASAFGCEIHLDGRGPRKSLRREASRAGCPTIVMEGGEVWKVEPGIVATAARGVKNVLREFGMIDGVIERPAQQVVINKSRWVRAERGGFLQFHISPGDFVAKGDALATNTTLLGKERSLLVSPFDAVVIGMTTLPAVSPGEPVCNLGQLPEDSPLIKVHRARREQHGLEEQVSEELGSNVLVVERKQGSEPAR